MGIHGCASAGHDCCGEVEAGGHVEIDLAVRAHMGPEQWGQAAPVGGGEEVGPLWFAEDVLEHQGVYLLTELPEEFAQFSGHLGKRVTMVPPRDRERCARVGSADVGRTAGRVAGGERRHMGAVPIA